MSDEEPTSLASTVLSALFCVVVGVCMLIWPDWLHDADTSGRRALIKMLFKLIWGYPGGIVFLLIGGVLFRSAVQSMKGDKAGK